MFEIEGSYVRTNNLVYTNILNIQCRLSRDLILK